MPIRLYNSLTGKKEEFIPKDPANVTMYVCGPTVYALSHIGHARSATVFDVISRYLRYSGFTLTYARNYTDVDDKIINRAREEQVSCDELAERFITAFDEDMAALGVLLPDARPRATQTIGKIIALTSALIEKGFAYASGADVFYSVRKKNDYGKLSGKKIDELEAGARVDVNEAKADPLDFALWKGSKPFEPAWDSPWGKGRPGWHIECSAMCMDRLGETIDIHGGGRDLIFPHHENEIAQSEAYTGKTLFARYWLHNGFVNIEKEKMSKSLGNILNIRDALIKHTPEAVRLFLLSSHYRSPIDYTQESLKDAENAAERLYKTIERIHKECPEATLYPSGRKEQWFAPVIEAMDDDFNTAMVIGLLFKEANRANRLLDEGRQDNAQALSVILSLVKEASGFLGVFDKTPEDYYKLRRAVIVLKISPDEIERLISERNEARKMKEFKKADEIRKGLLEQGVVLEDTAKGTTWST